MTNSNDKLALNTLRVGTALTLVGLAASVLGFGSPVFTWLWLEADWPEHRALAVDRAGACALLAAIPMLFVPRAWLGLKLAALWLLLVALATAATGSWYPWLAPADHASRILAPLAVALWAQRRSADAPVQWTLRVAAALTFAGHGVAALLGRGLFVDYALSVMFGLGAEPSQILAERMLFVVGIVDVACALAILVPARLRAVAIWMAAWGGMTALLRVYYAGWTQWPETLMRMANCAVPLTLFLLWKPRPEVSP
ncbi:MAG: hypothetical protein KF754_11300 [Planctomycetes bacterium]|nr:hypothetical protein [Planctomycetota bacterium]